MIFELPGKPLATSIVDLMLKPLRLSPYSFEGPIGYENLLAVKDFDAVNRRLEDAD